MARKNTCCRLCEKIVLLVDGSLSSPITKEHEPSNSLSCCNMYTRGRCLFLLSILIALSRLELAEGSRLKQVRRSIENSNNNEEEDSETTAETKGPPRRRLTLADDVFTTTSREFEVTGYHRNVGEFVVNIVQKFTNKLVSLFKFTNTQWRRGMNAGLGWFIGMLQSVQSKNEAAIQEAVTETAPPPTISTIYDSLSSAMSSSSRSSSDAEPVTQPTPNKQQPTTMSTPTNNIPKAGTGGSSFEALKSAAVSASEEENGVVPTTSMLAGLLPTLVAGLVFTTAGSMVGYLWNGEWAESASSVYSYFWGEDATEPSSSSYDEPNPHYGA
eukprot:jgi/Psemu1/327576/estExt_fgenesh1_pg.C_7210004